VRNDFTTNVKEVNTMAARKNIVHITGTAVNNGVRVFTVSSSSDPNKTHQVWLIADRLSCDCTAARYGRQCSHKALVMAQVILATQKHSKTGLSDANYNRPISIFK
jgi:hypothetical protein